MKDWAVNDRNVKALAQLIRKYELPAPGLRPRELDMARYLAGFGVLVPAALSDAAIIALVLRVLDAGARRALRDELERLARDG
jgi:hypothetical protein